MFILTFSVSYQLLFVVSVNLANFVERYTTKYNLYGY